MSVNDLVAAIEASNAHNGRTDFGFAMRGTIAGLTHAVMACSSAVLNVEVVERVAPVIDLYEGHGRLWRFLAKLLGFPRYPVHNGPFVEVIVWAVEPHVADVHTLFDAVDEAIESQCPVGVVITPVFVFRKRAHQ